MSSPYDLNLGMYPAERCTDSVTNWVMTAKLPKSQSLYKTIVKIYRWVCCFFSYTNEAVKEAKRLRRCGIKQYNKAYGLNDIKSHRCNAIEAQFTECFLLAMQLEPKNLKNCFYYARSLFALQDYENAALAFTQTIQLFDEIQAIYLEDIPKTRALLYACRGVCYEHLNDYLLAYQDYAKADAEAHCWEYHLAKERVFRMVKVMDRPTVSHCVVMVLHQPSCPYHHIALGLAYLNDNEVQAQKQNVYGPDVGSPRYLHEDSLEIATAIHERFHNF